MNPAAPVTNARKPRSQVRSKPSCVGGAGAHSDALSLLRRAIRPDFKYVAHVSYVSAQELKPAVAVIAPRDGHFFHAISDSVSQREDFDIEHISIDLLARKKIFGNRTGKEFKSALSIFNGRQVHDQMDKIIKSPG